MQPRVCSGCGATTGDAAAAFCARCGRPLARDDREAARADGGGGAGRPLDEADVAERFAALRAHPDFARGMERAPAPDAGGGVRAAVLGSAAVAGLGLLALIPSLFFPPLAVAVLIAIVLAILVLVAGAARARRAESGAWVRVPALVVGERTSVAGGSGGAVDARHHVRLLSERGTREEYEVDEAVASKAAPGVAGVAYFRGGRLVDFERVGADRASERASERASDFPS